MRKVAKNKSIAKRGNPRKLDNYRPPPFHKSEASWKFREMYLLPDKELGFVIRSEPKKKKPTSSHRLNRNKSREKSSRLLIKKHTLKADMKIITNSKQFVSGEIGSIGINESSIQELL